VNRREFGTAVAGVAIAVIVSDSNIFDSKLEIEIEQWFQPDYNTMKPRFNHGKKNFTIYYDMYDSYETIVEKLRRTVFADDNTVNTFLIDPKMMPGYNDSA